MREVWERCGEGVGKVRGQPRGQADWRDGCEDKEMAGQDEREREGVCVYVRERYWIRSEKEAPLLSCLTSPGLREEGMKESAQLTRGRHLSPFASPLRDPDGVLVDELVELGGHGAEVKVG